MVESNADVGGSRKKETVRGCWYFTVIIRYALYEQELILGMKMEDAQRFRTVVRETMNLLGSDVPTGYVRSVCAHMPIFFKYVCHYFVFLCFAQRAKSHANV